MSVSEQDKVAVAIGRAIATWANLESSLLHIFISATDMSEVLAGALFRHIKTFSLSLDLVNAAVQTKLKGKQQLTYWHSLVEYIRELSGDRNFMAHTPIIGHGPKKWTVGPVIATFLSDPDAPWRMLDLAELGELRADFQQATEILLDFETHVLLASSATYPEKYSSPIARRRPPRKQRLAGDPPKRGAPP